MMHCAFTVRSPLVGSATLNLFVFTCHMSIQCPQFFFVLYPRQLARMVSMCASTGLHSFNACLTLVIVRGICVIFMPLFFAPAMSLSGGVPVLVVLQ